MTNLAVVSTDSLQTLDTVALSTIVGGFDFTHAMQAGNTAAAPGREAGQTLGSGFDAGYKMFTGKDSTIGSQAGGPVGAAAGWVGGFATDTYQQLRGTKR